MRAFVSLAIDNPALTRIEEFIKNLSQQDRSVQWTKPENIHLTLKFLGETQDSNIYDISKRLKDAIAPHGIFSISIKGAGAFPSLKNPRILWIGIERSEPLQRLFHAIEDACCDFGFERDNKIFSPHITIGRIKSSANENLINTLRTYRDHQWGKSDVKTITLMKSLLKQDGPEYSSITEIALSMPENR